MGNTCKPLAVSFQCMTKSTTNKKKKKTQILKEKFFNIWTNWTSPKVKTFGKMKTTMVPKQRFTIIDHDSKSYMEDNETIK